MEYKSDTIDLEALQREADEVCPGGGWFAESVVDRVVPAKPRAKEPRRRYQTSRRFTKEFRFPTMGDSINFESSLKCEFEPSYRCDHQPVKWHMQQAIRPDVCVRVGFDFPSFQLSFEDFKKEFELVTQYANQADLVYEEKKRGFTKCTTN